MSLQCPKCLAEMDVVEYNGVEVDRCSKCYGLFFDSLEREKLKALKGAESLDIGDDFVGARFNEILDVPCPRCKVRMQDVLQEEPFVIKFEACPQCGGAFFDAGEFRDYLDDEIFESFANFVNKVK